MSSNNSGFTLVELLVVIAMIAILTAAMSSAMSGARTRARIQKATNDVKVLSQAILAYENYGENELPTLGSIGSGGADVGSDTIGFILGGQSANGQKVPAMIMASLGTDGKMYDPWGTVYKVHIAKGSGSIALTTAKENLKTGYFLPNFYRLGENERSVVGEAK